jgi:HSP20 family molecular chaperone IbpA
MSDLVGDAVRAALDNVGRVAGRFDRQLPADVLVGDEDVRVVFDAPGADVSDIDVDITDGVVTVRIERFRSYREGFTLAYPGRSLSLEGRTALPTDVAVDPAGARATIADTGVVTVHVPRVADGSASGDTTAEDATE